MMDPLLGEKLRSILAALRADLKPELDSEQAKLRCELIEMLLARLSCEVEEPDQAYLGVLAERDRRNALEARIEGILRAPIEPRGSSAELSIAPETFTKWLGGQGIAGEVTKVSTIPGGRSKGTLLLELVDGSVLVVRRDFSAAVTGTSVADEFPVIAAVHAAGLKVPRPLALEGTGSVIGGRFILFERVPGKAMGTLFASDASAAFCRNLARELARLHSCDIEAMGLSDRVEFGLEVNPVAALIAKYEAEYRAKMPRQPLMDEAFAFLHGQLPGLGIHRHLVHGDCALHNTMGEGDELTALLDWEFAHAGDPAEDLAYCRYLVSTRIDWDDFMAAYREAGGPDVSEARLAFFGVWRTLLLSVWTGVARTAFDSGKDLDLRVAAIGHNTFPRQLRALANDLAHAMELNR